MAHLNVEIKARCHNPDAVREALRLRHADFRGVDRQIDTYFCCPSGRLKLREGNIERSLIHYDREDKPGPRQSVVTLYHPQGDTSALKEALTRALGVLVIVEKRREIYFIANVKFHIDTVEGLGSFVEIEAIDGDGTIGRERLQAQCEEYMTVFGIKQADLLSRSYSDMLLDIEDNTWYSLATDQFFSGYGDTDSMYDRLD